MLGCRAGLVLFWGRKGESESQQFVQDDFGRSRESSADKARSSSSTQERSVWVMLGTYYSHILLGKWS